MRRFFYTIITFVTLNAALYYGQEWYHNADVTKAEAIRVELDSQKHTYIQLELKLEQINELADKTTKEEEIVALSNEYKELYKNYEEVLKKHNENVTEYNKLIKSSSTRWYLFPMPWFGKKNPL